MEITELEKIIVSKKELQKLLAAYQMLGSFLDSQKGKKNNKTPSLKTLYGIWKGANVNEKDFAFAKKSLFKTSL